MGASDRTAELAVQEDVRAEPIRTTILPEQYQVQGTVAAYRELIDIIEHGGTEHLIASGRSDGAAGPVGVPKVASAGRTAGGGAGVGDSPSRAERGAEGE